MKELVWKWNSILEGLIQARESWDELRKELQERGPREFQMLPVAMQKGLPNGHSTFDVAVVRLIEKQRGYGSLEELLVDVTEIETKEEEDVTGRGTASRGSAGRRTGSKT